MKRRTWAMAGVAAAAGMAGGWWALQRQPAPKAAPASEAEVWAMVFDRPEGGRLQLAPYRGGPLLLNFWATWCPPCVRELPMLSAFQREQGPRGWQVVGLAVDKLEPVQQFLQRAPLAFPVGMAGLDGLELARTLGNRGNQMPYTVVYGRAGHPVDRKLGAVEPEDLQRWVQQVG